MIVPIQISGKPKRLAYGQPWVGLLGNVTFSSGWNANHDLGTCKIRKMGGFTMTSLEPTSIGAIFPSGDIFEEVRPGMS